MEVPTIYVFLDLSNYAVNYIRFSLINVSIQEGGMYVCVIPRGIGIDSCSPSGRGSFKDQKVPQLASLKIGKKREKCDKFQNSIFTLFQPLKRKYYKRNT